MRLQDLHDEAEEALAQQDVQRAHELHQTLRSELAATAGWEAFAESARRNGMTRHTQRLLNSLGWRAVRIA